jgi:hypothetical protein
MEHRRADLWDMGFGSAVSFAGQETCRRMNSRHSALRHLHRGSRLASLTLGDDVRHPVLIGVSDRQCPVFYAEVLR